MEPESGIHTSMPDAAPGEPDGHSRARLALIITILILVIAGASAALMYLFWMPMEPEEMVVPDTIAPTISPTIERYEDIAEYTAGKPLPKPIYPDDPEREVADTGDPTDRSGQDIAVGLVPFMEHIRGNTDTPIFMIEYADLRHPYTGIMHNKLKELLENNAEEFHWVFRHYPATSSNIDWLASQSSECVMRQLSHSGFWQYIDELLKKPLPQRDTFIAIATDLGVDTEAFAQCLDDNETYNTVLYHAQQGNFYHGVTVSPSFVFKNTETGEVRVVDGINTIEYLQAVIDAML